MSGGRRGGEVEPAPFVPAAPEHRAERAVGVCWNCREEVGREPQCPHCVRLQPLGRSSDYFSVMGLPRRLQIDTRVLEPVYHALSRRFHPDSYRRASPRERVIALENSALLNQAYRTLRDPIERAAYLVQLERGRAGERQAGPPEALFERILEVQELLADFRLADPGPERDALRPRLTVVREELRAERDRRTGRLAGELFEAWDRLQEPDRVDAAAERSEVVARMEALLGERSYLNRVLDSLDQALEAGG
jgi:molecular chaperone HscB